jgi:ABC-2 type transport system permease protein
MQKIAVILGKEWLELLQQRMLLLSVLLLPVTLAILPLITLFAVAVAPESGENEQLNARVIEATPELVGLSEQAIAQVLLGRGLSTMMLLLPMLIPSILAAYSIVGEKNNRTLEPLLATPITIWELLLGKMLASLIPSVVLTWLASIVFIFGVQTSAVDPAVFGLVISPSWIVLLIVSAPLLSLIAISVMVMISSRTSDPRTAQQYSSLLVMPLMGVFVSQMFGFLVFNLLTTLIASLLIAALAALSLWGAAFIFQRDSILTRWK